MDEEIKLNKLKISIDGSVLLLVGPIGSFFSRFYRYLKNKNINVYKVSFPLYEFGFDKKDRIFYNQNVNEFNQFLLDAIFKHNIRHIFMYGNVLIPHKIALSVVNLLRNNGYNIDLYVFELGYLRPNFVTIEENDINYNSCLNKPKSFYLSKSKFYYKPNLYNYSNFRIRKIWKLITFIQHSFVRYNIVSSQHKLQPRPIYIWYQLKGFLLKYLYYITELRTRKLLFSSSNVFLVILQVAMDSQITEGSEFKSIYEFIETVIISFSNNSDKSSLLFFKHHPRDRGYNNYSKYIYRLACKYNIKNRVLYFHDIKLSKIFLNKFCKGVVLINSTVGFQSLYHSIPVKALGSTPYKTAGLTDDQPLDDFWLNPNPVNKDLFNSFYKYTIEETQIYGNFDGYFPFNKIFIINNID